MPLAPERWVQVKGIFDAVADLPAPEREERLDQLCAGDARLRREVESLLASEACAGEFLARSAASVPRELFAESEYAGRRFGAYQVVREIGRGGLGVVYLAERADEQFHKRVAIKLIKRGLDTDAIQQRFRREREILATLEHPNIARLLDAGTTEDGLSYFVMEYVEGEIITDYCLQRGLTIRERLDLFRKVCAATSHAHQHLVVHRDLKPSNILVTREGEPKLLDFGIAKLLRDEEVAGQTIAQQQVLTPEYASPEQIRGEPISTATDVYSLGVILRELTTQRSASVSLAEKTTQAGGMRYKRQLGGDLGNIIGKATHEEPQRRYASVAQFSEDIQRYLDGRTVQARPDSFRYRAGKFVGRNRVATAAALLVMLAIISALVVSIHKTNVARHQRDLAQRERNKAEEISRFLQRMLAFSDQSFTSVSPVAQRRDVTVNEMLGQIAPQVEHELANQPQVRAEILATIGSSYASQGNYAEAEKQLRASLASQRQSDRIVNAMGARTFVELGLLSYRQEKFQEADRILKQAVAWYRGQQAAGAKNFDPADLAFALDCLGVNSFFLGETKTATSLLQESLALVRTRSDEHGWVVRALATMDLGGILAMTGEEKTGEPLLKDALAQFHQLSDRPRWEMGAALAALGVAEINKKQFVQAEKYLRESEEIYRQTLGENNLYMKFNLHEQAAAFLAQNKFSEAEKVARRELEIARQLPSAAALIQSDAKFDIAQVLESEGEFSEAEKLLREALPSYAAAQTHVMAVQLEITLSECLLGVERAEDAEKIALEAREEAARCSPPNEAIVAMAARNLAAVYQKEGKTALAAAAAK